MLTRTLPRLITAKSQTIEPKRNFGIGIIEGAIVGTGAIIAGSMAFRYKVSKPDQYLVKTGIGIKDIQISKTGFVWPFQQYKFVNMRPRNYEVHVNAMSNQMMKFILPGVFTIGPKNDIEHLERYCRYFSENEHNDEKDEDENKLPEHKQLEVIIRGIIEGETRVLAAQMTLDKSKRRIAESNASLRIIQAELDRQVQIAQIESDKKAKMRDYELQKDVEQCRISTETEFLRAQDMSKAQVYAEQVIKEAQGKSESIKIMADANFYSLQKDAEAIFYKKQKEAEGIYATYDNQSKGLTKLVESFNGDISKSLDYLMLESGIYVKVLENNAKAVNGMKPHISYVVTDQDNNDPIRSLMRLSPGIGSIIDTVKNQFGIKDQKLDIIDKN